MWAARLRSLGVTPGLTEKLCSLELLDVDADGNADTFTVHDYLTFNPSRADTEARREVWRQAGKRGAAKRWGHDLGDGVPHSQPHRVMHPDSHSPSRNPKNNPSQDTPLARVHDEGGSQRARRFGRGEWNVGTEEDASSVARLPAVDEDIGW